MESVRLDSEVERICYLRIVFEERNFYPLLGGMVGAHVDSYKVLILSVLSHRGKHKAVTNGIVVRPVPAAFFDGRVKFLGVYFIKQGIFASVLSKFHGFGQLDFGTVEASLETGSDHL
jgi:hypothetical protein